MFQCKRSFGRALITFALLTLGTAAWAQGMSDEQIMIYVQKQMAAGASEADIATRLLQKGVTIGQLQALRNKYGQQLNSRGLGSTADNAINTAQERMRVSNTSADNSLEKTANVDQADRSTNEIVRAEAGTSNGHRVFGRNIFNSKNLTFEPQMNIATPQKYVLGPGDELVIDIYGASQESLTVTISPDGDVVVPNYGPLHVSGLTVEQARARISSKLGTIYSSSQIKTTLGQTRSIMVNVMGEVQVPGTYTLSAFATVFHALYRAGGIGTLGTLRNIKVYRQGKLISVVDVYEFILNGRLAGNVNLQDNDVIQVGTYDCIVDIEGHVKRPMSYEMRKGESLETLLRYAGGYSSDAYRKSLRLFRKTGQQKEVFNVDEFELSSFKLDDGDVVSVEKIEERYANMAEVKGAVFRPGMYRLGQKVNSVRTLIESAQGLTEEAMTARAVLRRLKPNRTQEVLSIDIEGILAGTTADIPLKSEDVLFVPTQADHQNLRTLNIGGEVIFPGTYEYADSMTLEDLILQAGGLTDLASTVRISVTRRFRDATATEPSETIAKTYHLQLDDKFRVGESDSAFILQPYDIVQVHRTPVFQSPIRVYVDGEVKFTGSYTMEKKNQRLSDVIREAGGVLDGAYVRGARLERTMNDDERTRLRDVIAIARHNQSDKDSVNLNLLERQTTYTVGIHLDEALANPGGSEDIEVINGDRIVIPRYNRTVSINGDVRAPNTVAFHEGKGYKYYVEQAGGFGNRAKKRKSFIVYQNGTMARATKGDIEPGCEIIVPSKEKRNPLSVAQWLGIGTSMATLGTMVASLISLTR